MKCERCNKQATVHLTEIKGGKQIEKHLCESCAQSAEGIPGKSHTPINELLTNFVLAHSGMTKDVASSCPHCGLTYNEFRQVGLLGCEHDYVVFEKELTPILQRAHEGATHHVGKAPTRKNSTGGVPAKRQVDLVKLRKELQRAVEAEDYERAAKLRDQIRQAETAG